jgi:hypothetical protein
VLDVGGIAVVEAIVAADSFSDGTFSKVMG